MIIRRLLRIGTGGLHSRQSLLGQIHVGGRRYVGTGIQTHQRLNTRWSVYSRESLTNLQRPSYRALGSCGEIHKTSPEQTDTRNQTEKGDSNPPLLSNTNTFQGNCCFLGGGAMATAIARGVVSSGFMQSSQITVSSPLFSEELHSMEDDLEIKLSDIGTGMNTADLVVIAVKPTVISQAVEENLTSVRPTQLFLSVCAGTSCKTIEEVCS